MLNIMKGLQRLQHLEACIYKYAGGKTVNTSKLTISVGDYRDVDIPPDSVIVCFDKETEILTQRGWINISDVKMDDVCLSRNPDDDTLQYVKIVKLISYPYQGRMYHYIGKNVDICVTPNHRMFCETIETRRYIRRRRFIDAEKFSKIGTASFISAGGIWTGDDESEIDVCGRMMNAVDFCYLLGVFVTAGCVSKYGAISISQTKQRVLDKIVTVLKRLGISHYVYWHQGRSSCMITIERGLLPYFNRFYRKENRKIPRDIMNKGRKCLSALFDGMMDGDGDSEDLTKRRRLTIGSKGLANDFQELCYKLGLSSNIMAREPKDSKLKDGRVIHGRKPYFLVSVNSKIRLNRLKPNQKWDEYNDMVYCVTLEKWHTVLVRRNGKPIWCGQCDIPYKDTREYRHNKDAFAHDAFYAWAEAQTHPVFVCEYWMPEDRFFCIAEFDRISTFSATNNAMRVKEKLFMPNKWKDWWEMHKKSESAKQQSLFEDAQTLS